MFARVPSQPRFAGVNRESFALSQASQRLLNESANGSDTPGVPYLLAWMEDDLIEPSLLHRLRQENTRPAEVVARMFDPSRANGTETVSHSTEIKSAPVGGDSSSACPSEPAGSSRDHKSVVEHPKTEIQLEIDALQQMLRSCTAVNDRTRKRLRECTQIAIWQQHLFAEERRHWYEADRQFRQRLENKKPKKKSKQVHAKEIIGKRNHEGTVQYLVSWLEAIPNSWHSVDDLKCQQLIDKFERGNVESPVPGDSGRQGGGGGGGGATRVSKRERAKSQSKIECELFEFLDQPTRPGSSQRSSQSFGGKPGKPLPDMDINTSRPDPSQPFAKSLGLSTTFTEPPTTTTQQSRDQTRLRDFIKSFKSVERIAGALRQEGVAGREIYCASFDTESEGDTEPETDA